MTDHEKTVDLAAVVAAGEELARKYRADLSDETKRPEGTREALERCATMLNTYAPECFPANEQGQIHFARAMMESTADEIRAYLAAVPPDVKIIADRCASMDAFIFAKRYPDSWIDHARRDIQALIAMLQTEQAQHTAWRKRAEEAEAERDAARQVARELAAKCPSCKGKGRCPYLVDVGGELVQGKHPDFPCPTCGQIRAANPWLKDEEST